jgi:hypothetical protein
VFRIFFLRLSFGIAVRPIHSSHPQEMKSNFVKKKKKKKKNSDENTAATKSLNSTKKDTKYFIAKINSLLKTRL